VAAGVALALYGSIGLAFAAAVWPYSELSAVLFFPLYGALGVVVLCARSRNDRCSVCGRVMPPEKGQKAPKAAMSGE